MRLAARLDAESADDDGLDGCRSPAYQAAFLRVCRFARDDTAPILLEGESGTGKTRMARLAHARSPRSTGPFHHVVLSALEESVSGSELFGHVAGAFTDARQARTGYFASANGGSLFLDEIGKTSRTVQGKLLHALEYGVIRPVGSDRDVRLNVRMIAATNVNLSSLAAEGRFLPDLDARLVAFRVTLPPLRERRADIPLLVTRSIQRHASAAGYEGDPPTVDGDLMDALQRAPWPNNIRELDGTVHRLLLEADGALSLTQGHCRDDLAFLAKDRPGRRGVTLEQVNEAVRSTGSLSGAARVLGVDRKTLRSLRGGGHSES